MSKPTPGSDEAVEQGCTCPVLDNRGRVTEFWISADCHLHINPSEDERGLL